MCSFLANFQIAIKSMSTKECYSQCNTIEIRSDEINQSAKYANCTGFDWNDGNSKKNWILHQVSRNESEQVFFNAPIVVGDDISHSQSEERWFLLGKTGANRLLFVVFTVREELIRVISSRDMSKKERRIYHEKS